MTTGRRAPGPVLSFADARPDDVGDVMRLRITTAERLTERFGRGHWSSLPSQRGVEQALSTPRHLARVLLARIGGQSVGVLRLAAKKPWAIDASYFTPVRKALYLTDMAVAPEFQGQGVGRGLLEYARDVAARWPAGAIRLDAYDARAGAGGFYAACGYREVGRVVYRKVPLIYYELIV